MHQCDVLGDVGQIQGFLHGGITATHHSDILAAIEESVAGGAAGNTSSHEGFLGRQAEILCRGAGGDDQRVTSVTASIADQQERLLLQLGCVDMIENHLRVETFSVFLKTRHQFRALHAHCIGGPVVHVGGGHHLAALGQAGDQRRIEVGARSVYGGGVTGGAGSQDDEAMMLRGFVHDSNLFAN